MMNLHNHTTYSDGSLKPLEVVEAAIDIGLSHIGITDHFATQKVHCVQPDELGQYTASLRELATRYEDRIRVLVGVEIDGSSKRTDFDALPYEELSAMDYVLVEYLQDPLWGGMDLWEFLPYRERISCPVGLAHSDIGKVFKDTPPETLAGLLETHGIFVELCSSLRNSKFEKPYYRYAEPFFDAARDRVMISVGTDTHYTIEEVGDLADAEEFIKKMGLDGSLVTDRYWK